MIKKFSGILFQSIFFNPLEPREEFTFGSLWKVFSKAMAPRGNPAVSTETHAERREEGGGRYHNVRLGREGWVTLQPRSANQPTQKRTRREGKKKKTEKREQKRRVQGTHSTTISWQKGDKKWPLVEISAVT